MPFNVMAQEEAEAEAAREAVRDAEREYEVLIILVGLGNDRIQIARNSGNRAFMVQAAKK